MSVITIQCRLVADENSLRQLWELMTEKNTPFINEILLQIGKHPEFETWLEKGRIPAESLKTLGNSLKTQEPFTEQPGRFYTSAIALVDYLYKSWFALQKRRKNQIEGKERWLKMLKSDQELEEESQSSLEVIRTKATELLTKFAPQSDSEALRRNQNENQKKGKKTKKSTKSKTSSIFKILLNTYEETEDILTHCALAYLLKNNCQISEVDEKPEEFIRNKRRKEIEIERLKDQLQSRIPKGRDLTGEEWLETLKIATFNVPQNENEAKAWQAALLRKTANVPFPVACESNEDMIWLKNDRNRLFVRFNGLGKLNFEIYCDKRHLHYFQRFLEDQEIKRNNKNQYSSSLFTLRSGRISWLPGEEKGEYWKVNQLNFYCSLDTRMMTCEGTKQVVEEKVTAITEILNKTKQKDDLNDKQQAFITRQQSTLARINNPFPRPSKPNYQGKSSILIGVSFGLEKPVTVAVVDVVKNEVMAYRSVKQLLGENYNLLNRQRQQQQRLSHERHKAQKQNKSNSFGESELGQYVDRLLADAIIAIAKKYQAGSIVLPKLRDMREQISSEIQSRAENRCPGSKEGQKKYAKEYRINVHRWSYGRLIESIQSQAAQAGIAIETGTQSIRASPQEKARDVAVFAYQERQTIKSV
ncbi:type V CRISPR-associated protein Cas12k [Cuspidothrix issatschenkoi LEGE 03284]|uniref:type V CRISPR-associated protein Cas12k n=1 Tax=Cuspidothrix issatschenkoi TaxID=230752 RepID=UPI0018815173|nr:type V CRISPR-associated protein Cas12k [Cuspidothrix issatschenkoi]MBE9233179.1 type V CRISPR-associated protein Cas12k [Cuspidothrix issatschenkoi LEGE 03284]